MDTTNDTAALGAPQSTLDRLEDQRAKLSHVEGVIALAIATLEADEKNWPTANALRLARDTMDGVTKELDTLTDEMLHRPEEVQS